MINRWTHPSHPNDFTDYDLDSETLKEKSASISSSSFLNSQSFLDRTLAQASSKSVPIALGGPGKIFVVVKHLSSKNLEDLRF